MQNTDSSPRQDSLPGWQILGELELAFGINPDESISKWLTVLLSPLKLHADFAANVLKSVQETISHAIHLENIAKSKCIHLIIFILQDPESNRQDWGFFRIEKVETESDRVATNHAIEFYLYQETH